MHGQIAPHINPPILFGLAVE
jgi:hypothetical protein